MDKDKVGRVAASGETGSREPSPASGLGPSGFHPARLLDLAERIRAAASREGKPRGDHMIAAEEQIARHFREHWADDEDAQDLADVADTLAHCLRAEKAMVDGLTAAGIEAAAALEALARSHNAPRDRDGAEGGDANAAPVPQDRHARAEGIAQKGHPND